MLAVNVAAHQKKLILSVGLFCLPYAAFGMDEFFPDFGMNFVGNGSKFARGTLRNKSLHKPNHSEVPTELSIKSRPSTRRVALPFVQAEIQPDSLLVMQTEQHGQPPIINDNVALGTSKIEGRHIPKTRTGQVQSQTLSSRLNNKRTALPFLLQEKNQQVSLSESKRGKQTFKNVNSFTQPLTVHNRLEPRNETTVLSQSQTLSPSRSRQTTRLSTAFDPPPNGELSTINSNLFTLATKNRQQSAAVPTHANLNRAETIQPGLFSSILNSKAEIMNEYIPNYFNAMGDYRGARSMTQLESLALKFYIEMTEARCIRLMDLYPDLDTDEEKIKAGELALFCDESGKLCCQIAGKEKLKIVRSDDPTVLGYEADSFDRILTALKALTEGNSHRYNIALQQEEDVQRALLDVNKDCGGPEILAAWDTERLFKYLSLCGYSLKAKGIKPWPPITGEKIKKINPEKLLDKFWNYIFTENLGTPDHLAKISKHTLELIISSATYLIETIKTLQAKDEIKEKKAEAQLKQLYQSLRYCYSELSKRFTLNEAYHYYSAKYLTELECYKEAWNHIRQCKPYLQNIDVEDGEIKWLKWLQYNQSTTIKKQKASPEVPEMLFRENLGKNYFEIANFTQILSILDNKNHTNKQKKGDHSASLGAVDKPDVVAVCYYLECLKNYYTPNDGTQVMGKIHDINQLSPDMLFHVTCTAYDVAKDDKKNTDQLLCIAHTCLLFLIEQKSKLNHDWENIIETVLSSTYSSKTKEFSERMLLRDSILKESEELILLRALFLSNIGQMIWNVDKKNDAAKSLYLSAANLFYYAGHFSEESDAKKQCSQWNNEIIESVIEGSIRSGSPVADISIDDKIINELCRVLVDRKYSSEVYLLALAHLKKREKWVTAFNLARSATNFIPSLKKEEFDQLKEGIEQPYNSVQNHKRFFGETFMAMTDMLTEKKKISVQQIKNWADECHLITIEQLIQLKSNLDLLIDRQQLYLSSLKEGSYYIPGNNFLVLEQEEYIKKVYNIFDLTVPPEKWGPDHYVNLGESQQNDLPSFVQISLDNHESTAPQVLEVKKNEEPDPRGIAIRKGHEKGLAIELLSEMFDLHEDKIKEILK